MSHTLDACLLAVSLAASSTAHFRDVTGGVYKARERIHGAVQQGPPRSTASRAWGISRAITSDSGFMQSSCRLQSELSALF